LAAFADSTTGSYRICCGGTSFTGVGKLTRQGKLVTIQHNTFDRRVLIRVDTGTGIGTTTLQTPPGTLRCTITERNPENNTCTCL
jgi:hypothetical protein